MFMKVFTKIELQGVYVFFALHTAGFGAFMSQNLVVLLTSSKSYS